MSAPLDCQHRCATCGKELEEATALATGCAWFAVILAIVVSFAIVHVLNLQQSDRLDALEQTVFAEKKK